ncbi:hypothetical protein WKH56_08055 [Priestia sp. SB1]|uniref:Uncharacterized protein n=1 Tax=Priestia aryabhattai TaxID=412384 RepID=A0AAX6NE97_PRIAR|nr:hypothetical protein [Priestia aryabhattai]MDU9694107.1 hypothetical protein [Priestia aryabhattai]NGY88599.1 hypothetical protein [Priestia megaterium]
MSSNKRENTALVLRVVTVVLLLAITVALYRISGSLMDIAQALMGS